MLLELRLRVNTCSYQKQEEEENYSSKPGGKPDSVIMRRNRLGHTNPGKSSLEAKFRSFMHADTAGAFWV
jgi:hypothetical protein